MVEFAVSDNFNSTNDHNEKRKLGAAEPCLLMNSFKLLSQACAFITATAKKQPAGIYYSLLLTSEVTIVH